MILGIGGTGTIFLFLAVIVLLMPPNGNGLYNSSAECDSAACLEHAYYLRKSLQKSANPCNNFYQYVCGSWTPPRKGQSSVGQVIHHRVIAAIRAVAETHPPVSKAKGTRKAYDMYKSCAEARASASSNIDELKLLMKQLKLSFLERIDEDPLKTLAILSVQWNLDFLFKIAIYTPTNATDNVIVLYPGSMINYFRADDLGEDFLNEQVRKHKELIFPDSEEHVEEFHRLRREVVERTHPLTIPARGAIWDSFQLQKIQDKATPEVNSSVWADILYNAWGRQYLVNPLDTIFVTDRRLFYVLNSLIQMYPWRLLNYISWKFVELFGWILDGPIATARFRARGDLAMAIQLECCKFVERTYGFALSARYLLEKVDDSQHTQITNFLNTIQESLVRLIDSTSWMDEATRQAARKKIVQHTRWIWLRGQIAYRTKLDGLYNEYPRMGSVFVKNWRASSAAQFQGSGNMLLEYATTSDPSLYRYVYHMNAVSIPMSLLFKPMYSVDAVPAMNYAGLGAVYAQLLMQLLDSVGVQFDHDNRLKPWLSEAAAQEHRRRAECKDAGDQEYLPVWEKAAFRLIQAAFNENKNVTARHNLKGLNLSDDAIFYMTYCYISCARTSSKADIVRRTEACNAFRESQHFADVFNCSSSKQKQSKACPSFW